MKVLERIFGPRVPDEEADERAVDQQVKLLRSHRATLKRVNAALSSDQRSIVDAIDDTGRAIQSLRRIRR